MSKIYVWSMKSSLHTNYRFRGTMKKLAIQIKREFAEVMNLKKIKPLTMNKQTVWVESDPINKDSILLTGGEEMKHVNKLDSVYVLTEQELEERDTQKLSDGWDACAKQLLIDISKTFLNPSNQDKALSLRDAEVFQAVGETILNFPIPDKQTFINQQINKQP